MNKLPELKKAPTFRELKVYSDFVGDSYTHAHIQIDGGHVNRVIDLILSLENELTKAQEIRDKYDKSR